MHVRDALARRYSTRAFLPHPVSRDTIERILDVARRAPSGANTQPWQVAVVAGQTRRRLLDAIEQAYRAGQPTAMEYRYYPNQWEEPYRGRRFECGQLLYRSLDIAREDKDGRREQWIANYRAFGAPVVLFFFMRRTMQSGSYMDMGMFIQSVMLAACEEGLATCPQAALGEYPDIVRDVLQVSDDYIVLCGMALGHEDTSAPVNNYRTPREPVAGFTRFHD
jgi:nitroreductase